MLRICKDSQSLAQAENPIKSPQELALMPPDMESFKLAYIYFQKYFKHCDTDAISAEIEIMRINVFLLP